MQEKEKLTEQVRVALGETLFLKTLRLAAEDDRTISEFYRHVMARHVELHELGLDIRLIHERRLNTKADEE